MALEGTSPVDNSINSFLKTNTQNFSFQGNDYQNKVDKLSNEIINSGLTETEKKQIPPFKEKIVNFSNDAYVVDISQQAFLLSSPKASNIAISQDSSNEALQITPPESQNTIEIKPKEISTEKLNKNTNTLKTSKNTNLTYNKFGNLNPSIKTDTKSALPLKTNNNNEIKEITKDTSSDTSKTNSIETTSSKSGETNAT